MLRKSSGKNSPANRFPSPQVHKNDERVVCQVPQILQWGLNVGCHKPFYAEKFARAIKGLGRDVVLSAVGAKTRNILVAHPSLCCHEEVIGQDETV